MGTHVGNGKSMDKSPREARVHLRVKGLAIVRQVSYKRRTPQW